MQRRIFLSGLGLLPAAGPLLAVSSHAVRADAHNKAQADNVVQVLYVQSAHGADLADGRLRLKGISSSTIFFSDRPRRITGHEPTEDFVGGWGEGEESFASIPPNATLSILTGPEPQEIVVVLKNPRFEKNDLIYDVEVLDGKASASGGASSLFIDTIGRPLTPVSVAGVHRRRRRRVRRARPGPL